MPLYSIRYVCESPLISDEEITFEFNGHSAQFTFPPEQTERGRLHVTIEADAGSWKQADLKAQAILQPIADAVAFATSQPVIVSYWDFIRKDESGSESRKAIWCERSEVPNRFTLTKSFAAEAQEILRQNVPPAIALCWHRYAGHRGYWLDRFVFQWLAFESLAGESEVTSACENCGHVHTHRGANRAEALRIFQAAEPEISAKEFKDEVAGKDRNIVFHGSKYPGPLHLQRLNTRFPKLRTACEMEICRRYGLQYRPRPIGQSETHFFKFQFIEWKTAAPESVIAKDFPWLAVKKEFSNRAVREAWFSVPSELFNPLNFQRDAANW